MTKRAVTIIQMNDTHGYLEEHWEQFTDGVNPNFMQVGGYSRIASYLKQVRKEKDSNVLFLDGGDTFHGTYPVVKTKGKIIVPLLNEMKVDAMTAHWEFAYGPYGFKQLLNDLNYPMLAINCYDSNTHELVFDPYLIKEINDIRIGIIGIAATIIDKVMPKHFSEGLYFTLGNVELPSAVKKLREKEHVDMVVVLSHLGFPADVKLAEEVDGIDVYLSAHTHNRITNPVKVNNSIMIQSGCHGSFLGHLDLIVEDKKIISYKHQLVVLDKEINEDNHMKQMINQAMLPFQKQLKKVLGSTQTDLSRIEVFESTMDNFLLQTLLHYTDAEIAFSNGWRYGAPIVKGEITENDLWNIIPVNPPVSLVNLSGKEIWDMMEENLERTFANDAYEQMGGYVKRTLGMTLYVKIENPFGQRIQNIVFQEAPLDPNRIYEVVFVTSQGVPEQYGVNRRTLDIHAIDILKLYLQEHSPINCQLQQTFRII